MLADLVIDTNVLMHADNPIEPRQGDSARLLADLLASDTLLVVDEGFDLDEAKNSSLIGHEYLTLLSPLSVGYAALVQLFSTDRVNFVTRSATPVVRNQINRLLRNKRDRTFVLVARNSQEQVLCSHDYKDLSVAKRRSVRAQLGVTAEDAVAVAALV